MTPTNQPPPPRRPVNPAEAAIMGRRVEVLLKTRDPELAIKAIQTFLDELAVPANPYHGWDSFDDLPLSLLTRADTKLIELLGRRGVVRIKDLRKLSNRELGELPRVSAKVVTELRGEVRKLLIDWQWWRTQESVGVMGSEIAGNRDD